MNEDQLERLAAGLADPDLLSEMETHVEHCAVCRRIIAGIMRARSTSASHIDRYRVLRPIGVGASALVYLAYDEHLQREVAIKTMHRAGDALARWQKNAEREARALARLQHPNVVSVYEVGVHDGYPFIAMEFVDGDNLTSWRRIIPRSWRATVALFIELGAGLSALHDAGLLHRDIKPENILVGKDGRPRLADLGLAEIDADAKGAFGTPAYMAPEQLSAGALDVRTDIFGFCATLYEALAGSRPFSGATREALLVSIARGPQALAHVPGWLNGVLARGLSAIPDQRFSDMASMIGALAAAAPEHRARKAEPFAGLQSLWARLSEHERQALQAHGRVTTVDEGDQILSATTTVWVASTEPRSDAEGCAAIYWDFEEHSTMLAAAGVRHYEDVPPFSPSAKHVRASIGIPSMTTQSYIAEVTAYRTGPNAFLIRWHVPKFDEQPGPGLRQSHGSVELESMPGARTLFVHHVSALLTTAAAVSAEYKEASCRFHSLLTELLLTRFQQGARLEQVLALKAALAE